jgi:DNA polymerase III subunit epsilon
VLVAFIDTETTGLDPQKDALIETAFAVYDFTPESFSLVEAASFLYPCDENAAQSVNGISPELTKKSIIDPGDVFESLIKCDCVVAHNAAFDRSFLVADHPILADHHFVCAVEDYKLDCGKSRKLTHVCADNGIFFTAAKHRALVDVMMLAELVNKLGYSAFLEALAYSQLPKWDCVANVSFAQKEQAKEAGFKWVPESKTWEKTVKTHSIAEYENSLPFSIIAKEVK